MSEHIIKIEKRITTDDIVNILCCESGGFDYWCNLKFKDEDYKANRLEDDCYEDVLAKILENGKSLIVNDFEEEETYELTLEKLLNGIELNYKNRPFDCDIEDGDATTADCILQYSIFGDVIYG